MKRVLIAVHRYLGVGLCLLCVVWFASGVVMVFAGFPRLTEERRLAALPPLVLPGDLPLPARVLAPSAPGGRIRLGDLEGQAVYRFVDGSRSAGVIPAAGGRQLRLTAGQAAAMAARFSGQQGSWAAVDPVARRDQWTTTSPGESQFPLLRLRAGDSAATEIYLSLATGEVVQATSARDRLLAWVGAIPHWIYPIALRRHAAAWRQTVLWLSGLGVIASVSGIILGLWSLRPRRWWRGRHGQAPAASLSPYRDPWLRWHHYLGLAFGVLVFTWVGSGALSLTPFRWTSVAGDGADEDQLLAGGPLQLERFTLSPARALEICRAAIAPRELELVQLGGRPHYLCVQSPASTRLVAADRPEGGPSIAALDRQVMLAMAAPLWKQRPLVEATVLTGDDYHYQRNFAPDHRRPLLRVRAGVAPEVWYYFDLGNGRLVLRLGPRDRLERWLYNGLHSLDFPALYRHPRLWRVTIVALSLAGLVMSATGIAVSLGWLARVRGRQQRARQI